MHIEFQEHIEFVCNIYVRSIKYKPCSSKRKARGRVSKNKNGLSDSLFSRIIKWLICYEAPGLLAGWTTDDYDPHNETVQDHIYITHKTDEPSNNGRGPA